MLKPKMTKEKFNDFLGHKGIVVDSTDENYALERGFEHNYIYKLLCYRDNYEKDESGKYINLKLNNLVELSHIDTLLRYTLLELSLDLEHIIRCRFLEDIADSAAIDGYKIVNEYFDYLGEQKKKQKNAQAGDILDFEERKAAYQKVKTAQDYAKEERTKFFKPLETSKYSRARYLKYKDAVPVWLIIDSFTMGDLARFSKFYFKNYCAEKEDSIFSELNKDLSNAKNIRNLAAHNQPILVNVRTDKPDNQLTVPAGTVTKYLKQLSKRHKETIINNKKTLTQNKRIHDLITLLALYENHCPDNQYKKLRQTEVLNVKGHWNKLDKTSMPENLKNMFQFFDYLIMDFTC